MGLFSILTQIILMAVCLAMTSIVASASDDDISNIQTLISSFDDPHMTTYDLAFYLATHGYDATPTDGYVRLVLKGTNYNLIPNGEMPELCDIVRE